jgi:hypothetical protein
VLCGLAVLSAATQLPQSNFSSGMDLQSTPVQAVCFSKMAPPENSPVVTIRLSFGDSKSDQEMVFGTQSSQFPPVMIMSLVAAKNPQPEIPTQAPTPSNIMLLTGLAGLVAARRMRQ